MYVIIIHIFLNIVKKKGKYVKSFIVSYIIDINRKVIRLNFITKETKYVEISDVDYMFEYHLCHLFERFTELAIKNATEIGLWNHTMTKHYGWVVAKQSLHLDEPICYEDVIELSTTVSKGSFVSFPRYYFVSKNNQQIGYCSSIWTLIDIEKRRMVSPKRIGMEVPLLPEKRLLETPSNIEIDIDMEYIQTREVLYSDIDVNQHMNNTKYIQWVCDLLDDDIHKKNYICDISIQYKKEIAAHSQVELYMGHLNNRYLFEGKCQGIVCFIIEIILKSR